MLGEMLKALFITSIITNIGLFSYLKLEQLKYEEDKEEANEKLYRAELENNQLELKLTSTKGDMFYEALQSQMVKEKQARINELEEEREEQIKKIARLICVIDKLNAIHCDEKIK